jgi:RNA-binding protein
MSLTSKERAELRAEAHRLRPLVHLGQGGLAETVIASLDDALRTRELVKVALPRQGELPPREVAGELAEQVGAEVVQVIGKTATLYRHNPGLHRKPGALPPWRA